MSLVTIAKQLGEMVDTLQFTPPVSVVYNPLTYAWQAHELYLQRWGGRDAKILLLGMNPGPWGMVQTGVPFGEVDHVRDWLGIDAEVSKPKVEHPKRPVEGMACGRSEVSGRRLWSWAKKRFGTPERFFGQFFVANYCPLAFLEEGGRNRTPDKLDPEEREALFQICDEALRDLVDFLSPELVIGIGVFAEKRAQSALGRRVRIGRILHPSPASPAANRGWAKAAEKDLVELGISLD